MAYRIRYEIRKRRGYGWLVAGAVLAAAAVTKEHWYWELARYVGRMIRGAG